MIPPRRSTTRASPRTSLAGWTRAQFGSKTESLRRSRGSTPNRAASATSASAARPCTGVRANDTVPPFAKSQWIPSRCGHRTDLVDRGDHRPPHLERGLQPVRLFEGGRRTREQRTAPPAVTTGCAEAGDLFLEHDDSQGRRSAQEIVRGPQAGEPAADDRNPGRRVAAQRRSRSEVIRHGVVPERQRPVLLYSRDHASVSTARRMPSISSNSAGPIVSGGASCTTGSPRSSARQYRPASKSALERNPAQQALRLVIVERLLRLLVLDQFDSEEVAVPAHVADDGQVGQALECSTEQGRVAANVLEQLLLLEDVEVRERDSRRHGMTAESVAVVERRGAVLEGLVDAVADDRRADGRISARHPLRAGDHVGLEAVGDRREHVSDAAEARDDLVGDQQNVVLVADLANPLEIPGRRREASAAVLHRLKEDCRDGVGTLEQDHLLDAVRGPQAELLFRLRRARWSRRSRLRRPGRSSCSAHGIRRGHRLEHVLHGRDARDGEGSLGGAVVGDRPRDHLVLGRATLQLPEVLRQLECRFDGFTAAGREEHAVQVAGGVGRQAVGEFDGSRMRVRPDREEGEFLRLLGSDLGEPPPPVAGIHDEQSREAVEVALTLESQMWWPSPRTMIGTPPPSSMTDWREKCIQRWSLAFC